MFSVWQNFFREKRFLAIIFLFIFSSQLLIFCPAWAVAGVPQTMSYQGRLADSAGDLVGGSGTIYSFKFSLWDSATVGSGNRVWPVSTPTAVTATVRQGLFNINIGDTDNGYPDALNYDFSLNNKIYLQIEVSSDALTYETLSPRQPITSAPFAQVAGSVYGSGVSTVGGLVVNGNSTTTNATTTGAGYFGTALGLAGEYIGQWSDLATYLPSVTGWGEESDGLNFNTLLDAKDKGYFFSTTSANVWGATQGYLTSFTEADPYYAAASTTLLRYGTTSDALTEGLTNKFYTQAKVWTDIWASSTLATTLANAVTAFGWGDHASQGYLTSYDETDPLSIHIGTTSVDSITELSNLSITESQISDLGTYLTSFTEADPYYAAASTTLLRYGTTSDALTEGLTNKFYTQAKVWTDIWASSTLATTLANAVTAFGWGDHASAGYLTTGNASSNYLSLSGGTLSGIFTVNNNLIVTGTSTLATTTVSNLSGNIITSNDLRTAITDLDTRLYNQQNQTKEPTGFPNTTDSTVSFNNSNRIFTIQPSVSSYDYYIAGKKYSTTTAATVTVPDVAGQINFIYFDSNGLLAQTTDGSVFLSNAQIATVYWTGTEGIVGFDRHGLTMDMATHNFLHRTFGTRYVSGLTGVFDAANTFTMTEGVIADEDNIDNVPATTTGRIFYRNGSVFNFEAKGTGWYYTSGGNIYYDNAGTISPSTRNNYVAYWVFAVNDRTSPLYILMGQRQDHTLANAQANNLYSSLTLGQLPFPEMKLLYRVIVRNATTPTVSETLDYRTSGATGSSFTASAHNLLTGLDFNSSGHTGFAGLSADNVFTGGNTFAGATITNATITNSSYVTGTTTAFGGLIIGSLTGILKAVTGAVVTALVDLANDVTGVLGIANGGTGLSSAPSFGQLLLGNASGGYTLTSTSSLGFITTNVSEGSNLYYTIGRVQTALASGYNSIFGNSTTTNATTTNLAITGLATPAGAFLSVDNFGRVISTTTPTGSSSVKDWTISGGLLTPTTTIGISLPSTLSVTGTSTLAKPLIFTELAANGSNYVGLKAPDSIANDLVWTLPNIDGGINSFLATDGVGNLFWGSSSPGTTAFLNEVSIVSSGEEVQNWINMPLILTEFYGSNSRKYVNLSNYTEFRIVANQVVQGTAGAILRVQYSIDDGSNWANLQDTSTSSDLSADTTAVRKGVWGIITSAAKTDVLLRLVGSGGNGAQDPGWQQLSIQFKGYSGSQWATQKGGNLSFTGGFVGIGTTTPQTAFHVVGTTTLATTTMSYLSQIGDSDSSSYFSVTSTNLNDPGDLGFSVNQIPLISFHNSSDVVSNNQGAVNNGLLIVEDLFGTGNPEDDSPSLTFAAKNISDILDGSLAKIIFATTTAELSFSGATAYNFDVPISEASDLGLKTNVNDLAYGLKDILALRPVSFDYLRTGKSSLGFIAQEVKGIIPEVVTGQEGSYGLNYSVLTALMAKGIQEQQQQIDGLANQFSLIFNASTTPRLDEEGFLSTSTDFSSTEDVARASTSTALSLLTERLDAGYSIIKNFFAERLVAMVGIFDFVKTKVLETETLRVEKGMEIKDAITGETYCVVIVNGEWQKTKGGCSSGSKIYPSGETAPSPGVSSTVFQEVSLPTGDTSSTTSTTTPVTTEGSEDDSTVSSTEPAPPEEDESTPVETPSEPVPEVIPSSEPAVPSEA